MECEKRLDSPLTKEEEEQFDATVAKKISKLTNEADDFYVSRLDKVIYSVLFLGAILQVVVLISMNSYLQENELVIVSLFAIFAMVLAAMDLAYPSFAWKLYRLRFIFTIRNIDDLQPSEMMIFMRRLSAYVFLILGYGYLVFVLLWF
jgi:hypothetical protein